MNRFSVSVFAAALSAHSAMAALGVACVDTDLLTVFGFINACRTETTCLATTDYSDNVYPSDATDHLTWNMQNNFDTTQVIEMSPIQSTSIITAFQLMEALTLSNATNIPLCVTADAVDGAVAGEDASCLTAMPAVAWSEGLALGSQAFTADWVSSSGVSLTTATGTTTASRAGANGTVSGLLTEAAYFFATYTLDPVDLMRFIITNDGSANKVGDALFSFDVAYKGLYNFIGMSYAVQDGCTMSTTGPVPCDVVLDVVVAQGYTNASGVAECSTEISYGGGDCDPDAAGQAVFEAINSMRTQMSAWRSELNLAVPADSLLTCQANGLICAGTFDGSASANRTYIRTSTNIQAASDAMNTAGTQGALEWTPGLYWAAKDQAAVLATATAADSLTSVGADPASAFTGIVSSSFAERLAVSGVAGTLATEILLAQNTDTADWAVRTMLIDDLDTESKGRTALLSSSAAQAGVAGTANATLGTVIVAVVDNTYAATDAEPCTAAAVVVVVEDEPDMASALLVAGSVALVSALIM